jgi:hypothetical protein
MTAEFVPQPTRAMNNEVAFVMTNDLDLELRMRRESAPLSCREQQGGCYPRLESCERRTLDRASERRHKHQRDSIGRCEVCARPSWGLQTQSALSAVCRCCCRVFYTVLSLIRSCVADDAPCLLLITLVLGESGDCSASLSADGASCEHKATNVFVVKSCLSCEHKDNSRFRGPHLDGSNAVADAWLIYMGSALL